MTNTPSDAGQAYHYASGTTFNEDSGHLETIILIRLLKSARVLRKPANIMAMIR